MSSPTIGAPLATVPASAAATHRVMRHQSYGFDQVGNIQRFLFAFKQSTRSIARPRRFSREGPPTPFVSTIAVVPAQSKQTPLPAKAPSAFCSGSIRIEASVGRRGACRGRVMTANRAAHRSQGPRPRAAARRCRVRLAICRQCARCLPEVRFFCVVPAGRPVPVSSWRFLVDVSLTLGVLTQMTKVYTNDCKFATRSCPDRRLFVAPSLTSSLLGYLSDF